MATEAELKAIQKLTQSIGREMDALSDKSDKRNKKLQQEADTLKSITSEISSAEDAAKARARIQQRLNNLTNKNLGVNEGLKKSLKIQMQTASKAVAIRQKEFGVVEKVGSIVDGVTEGMISGISKLSSQIQQVPVLGNIIAKPLEAAKSTVSSFGEFAKEAFRNAFFMARLQGMSFQKSFASGMGEMKLMARSLGPILVNPFVLAAAAVAALLGAGLVAFYKLEQAARAFRNETGLLNSQTQQTEQNINQVYKSTVGLGASMEDVAQTAAAFTNEFGGIEQPAENTIKSMVVLNKNFGVAIQDSAKVNKIFQNMAGVSEEVAQRQSEIVVELSRQAGVAPRQVMADIAESADEAGGFFRGNTKEMIRQSVAARAMGSSLKEVANVSRQLLDYQSSIESEMEASAILQTNLNFSQARYMAATGDIVGAQQNMVKQLRNRVDLENASVFEREAIAKATGMEYNQLLNLSRIQERFGDLKTEQMAAAQSLLKQGKDLSKLTSDDLAAETKRLANQEEMQGKLESMGNRLGAIGAQLLQAFLPIGEMLVSAVESVIPVFSMVGDVMKETFSGFQKGFKNISPLIKGIGSMIGWLAGMISKSIGPAIKFAFAPLKFAFDVIGNITDLVTSLVNDGLSGFVSKAKEMGPLMAGIATTVGLIGTIWAVSILPSVIATAVSLGTTIVGALVAAVPILFTFAASMVTSAIAAISTMSALTLGLGALAIAGGIAAAAVAMDSSIDSSTSKVESVNDAVISPSGDIVSTAPDDWLIATKTPQTLGQQPTPIPNISMDGVINELRELKAAFLANKDVYIDNERMTSKISRTQEKMITNQFGLMGT